jgi:co-chaperonin GroES (HSP10)
MLVKPDEVVVSSVIATPDSVQGPRAESGVIMERGHNLPGEFALGRRIAFAPHAGTVAELQGGNLLLLTPSEVMAFIESEPEVPDGAPV